MSLHLDWTTRKAAKYAVDHWHYSRRMPAGKNAYIGVWEDGRFIGAVVFGARGGNVTSGKRWGLARSHEVAELVRVALSDHAAYVSRIVAVAVRMIRKQSPGLRLLISMADPRHGHDGRIYQAGNWLYVGQTSKSKVYVGRDGREYHERVVSPTGRKKQYGRYVPCMKPSDAVRVIIQPGKHIYLMPLADDVRARLVSLSRPYPKCVGSIGSDASAIHAEEGGANPTPTLQFTGREAQRGG